MKKHLLTLNLLCFVTFLQAQTSIVQSLSFDSEVFTSTRQKLNNLDAEPFEKLIYETNGLKLPYRLLSPKKLKTGVKYPLVIAIHNSSRLGDDNEKQLEPLTRTWLKDEIRTKFPAFVLAPQFETRPTKYAANDIFGAVTATPQQNLQALLSLIESLTKNPQIDTERIYLIGYSMGGSVVQHLLSFQPDRFAAAISVAGVPDVSNLQNIKR